MKTISYRWKMLITTLTFLYVLFLPIALFSGEMELTSAEHYQGESLVQGPLNKVGMRPYNYILSTISTGVNVFSLLEKRTIHEFPKCTRLLFSENGTYMVAITAIGGDGEICYDGAYTCKIYQGTSLLYTYELEIFINEEDSYYINMPLLVDEKSPGILVFTDPKTIKKFDIHGNEIFAYSLVRGDLYGITGIYSTKETNIYLKFDDGIEVFDRTGSLIWDRAGAYFPMVQYDDNTETSFLYSRSLDRGENISAQGALNYTFKSFYPNESFTIIPDNKALFENRIIDLNTQKTTRWIYDIFDAEYGFTEKITISSNGEYVGSLLRRYNLQNDEQNYKIKTVDSAGNIILEYTFDFPDTINHMSFIDYQISNDGKVITICYGDLSSNIYVLTFGQE